MKKILIIAAAALAAAGLGYGIYRATKKNNNETTAPAKPEEGAEQPAAPAPAPEAPAPEAGKTDEKENK